MIENRSHLIDKIQDESFLFNTENIENIENFYNRGDYIKILDNLSPLRAKLEKATPFLHYLGLITNAICIVVLVQKQLIKRKSIFYLIYLAISDFLYNFLTELPNFLIMVKLANHDIFKLNDLSCFFYDYRITTFHFYSVIITLFVTIERFVHIYSPLKFNRSFFFNNTKSKLIIGLCLFIFALILALPHGFLMTYNHIEKDCDGREFFRKQFKNTDFTNYQMYFTFTEPVIIWFIPGIIILCMNFYVIYKILKSKQNNSCEFGTRFYGNSNKERKNNEKNVLKINDDYDICQENQDLDEAKNIYEVNNIVCQDSNGNEEFKLMTPYLTKKEFDLTNTYLTTFNSDFSFSNGNKRSGKKNTSLNENKQGSLKENPMNSTIQKNFNKSNHKCSSSKKDSTKMYLNIRNKKISVNQISHYITIITLGFYLILSTIPYAIVLSFQNNLTLKLNYYLREENDYYTDKLWIRYGILRDWVMVTRLFFHSNHCFNFFLYFVFNRLFRLTLKQLIKKLKLFLIKHFRFFSLCIGKSNIKNNNNNNNKNMNIKNNQIDKKMNNFQNEKN